MRFRLSNGFNAAVEFDAGDVVALRAGVETAIADYREAHGAVDRFLELHVAFETEWLAPVHNTPKRVLVGDVSRPADDYGDIWTWCETAVRGAADLRHFSRRTARFALPPDELGDVDRA